MANTAIEVNKPQKMTFSMAINSTGYQKLINNTIKDPKRAQRFVTAVTSAVSLNPQLQECENSSILAAALQGETLELSPSPALGHYYMVPYNSSTGKKAQFQMGYKGYIQLALRSGCYKRLNVIALKAGELKSYDPFTEEIEIELMKDDVARENAKTTGYAAMFEYTNGFRKVIYWSREKMEAHALRYSKGYKSKSGYTFWEKDFDAMAFKTMLRQLISKWGIMSIDLQSAFEQDFNVVENAEEAEYILSESAPVVDAGDIANDEVVHIDLVKVDENGEVIEEPAPKQKNSIKGKKQIGLDEL